MSFCRLETQCSILLVLIKKSVQFLNEKQLHQHKNDDISLIPKLKMSELHMYQENSCKIYQNIDVFSLYHSKMNIPRSFSFNILNLCFSTTTKKAIFIDAQMKVKKMMNEKYLLKSCSKYRKSATKEEEGNNDQNIQLMTSLT